jgi:acetyltransferase-like isoleucine patch superfamily enzyme
MRARQLLFDVVTVAFLALLAGPAAIVTALFVEWSWPRVMWPVAPLVVVPAALLFCATLCVAAWIVRLPIGKLRAGRYKTKGDFMVIRWGLLFALQRVLYLPLWRTLIFNVGVLRWLCTKALGGRVDYGLTMASDALLVDVSMLHIENGAMITAHCSVYAHFFDERFLLLGPVHIGKGANLLEGTRIGPSTKIGDGALIGPECRLTKVDVGAGARLGPGVVALGPVTIGEGAVIGSLVQLGTGTVVGKRARIRERTIVPRGTKIADGERYPPKLMTEGANDDDDDASEAPAGAPPDAPSA